MTSMDPRKRKFPGLGLDRRVRARAEPEPEDFDDVASEASEHDEESGPEEDGIHGVSNDVCLMSSRI